MPLFKHVQYIETALASVLSQTSPADEIILVDDDSSDNGFDLAQRMVAGLPYAKNCWLENAGGLHTIKRAIAASRGKYVAVLNSDHIFMPTRLERCRSIARIAE